MIDYRGADKDFSLAGKTAVITGGAAGIGYAVTKFFSEKGVNAVIADINPKADEAAKGLAPQNIGVTGDVRSKDYCIAVIEKAAAVFGGVDILVNSAGIAALEKAELLSEDYWDSTMAINLKGSFLMAQAFGNYLINSKRPGSIVNLASQAGTVALDRHVAYCASKGGIVSMTKVLALEWGGYGIRVNCVSPTVVLTELGHKAWDGPAGDKLKSEMPSGRFAEPDEIAGVIAFLCSNSAAMITGHDLIVDGGFTIK